MKNFRILSALISILFFLFILAPRQPQEKVYAQNDIQVCENFTYSYDSVRQNVVIKVQLSGTLPDGTVNNITADKIAVRLFPNDGAATWLPGHISGYFYQTTPSTDHYLFQTDIPFTTFVLYVRDIFPEVHVYSYGAPETELKNVDGSACVSRPDTSTLVLPANFIWGDSCYTLPEVLQSNKYTCEQNPQGSGWIVDETYSYCDDTSEPNYAQCNSVRGVGLSYCAPCVPKTTHGTLGHGASCSISRSNGTDPCDSSQLLHCRSLAADPTRNFCQRDTNAIFAPRSECVIGGDECNTIDIIYEPHNPMLCGSSVQYTNPSLWGTLSNDPIGCNSSSGISCLPAANDSNGNNPSCSAQLHVPATCYTTPGTNNYICVPMRILSPTPAPTYIAPTTIIGPTSVPPVATPGGPVGINVNNFECPGGIQVVFGCIPSSPGLFITFLFTILIGLAGGIAFLLILIGAFKIIVSHGNPEEMNIGKEIITAAVTGLLFILFSVFLLRVLGVDLLGIPGFQPAQSGPAHYKCDPTTCVCTYDPAGACTQGYAECVSACVAAR